MILSHKIRIYPNSTSVKEIERNFGYARYSFNRGLAMWKKMYEADLKPNERKVRDALKKDKSEWEKEYSPTILDNSIKNLSEGYKRFFNKTSINSPKFKKKGKARDSFTFNRKNDSTIRVRDNKLLLPKFTYPIKLSEELMISGVVKTCTITKRADKYFASFAIELDDINSLFRSSGEDSIGIDANIGHFDDSNGDTFKTPLNTLNTYYNRINYLNKVLSKKKEGSKKYNEVKTKLQRTYYRISEIQSDWMNKYTTHIVTNYHNICIEDLNVSGMLSNRRLAKKISRSLFYRFRLLLETKSSIYGNNLIIADRFFPSTQICSDCGNRKTKEDKLKLSDRVYRCYECGIVKDRDYNSACNLKIYAEEVG